MLIRKLINKIRNIDKIVQLKHESNAKDKIIRCYQRGNDTLKSEIEQLTKEISHQTDCAIGPWCDNCKHLRYSTLPNEQQMVKNTNGFVDVYDISKEFYYIRYCGKHTHEFCKEWEGKNK